MILDVGCGPLRMGDVAVDLYPEYTPQAGSQHKELRKISRGEYFVVGDACSLPFRDRCFEGVFCFHVLEHLNHPFKAFKELCRVSRGFIEVEVPHRLSRYAKMPFHVSYFDGKWFRDAARRNGIREGWQNLGFRWRSFPMFIGNLRITMRIE